ncbi:hypothetical protein FGE12_08470 [Aggregicoccus sp. 17bor-14]|uniref:hypothetical protein n=1 Tax=Myxococcaceae TaxID=31 RepID=UPI00129C4345|nr:MULTISPECIES: hypothetical protein [Myxococcaceae]MBF5042432.1 hypothetical protein [Simulacricoccus sp. 17bor-14]MRI88203.1 hypothetical protein [Aggregicoccus sp. 17bor-14]
MQLFEEPGIARAHWEPSARAVRVEWLAFTPSALIRKVAARGMKECQTHAARAWIADTRNTRGAMLLEDQEWLAKAGLPALRQVGIRAVITITPTSALTAASNRRWQASLQSPEWSVVEVATLEEALALCAKL